MCIRTGTVCKNYLLPVLSYKRANTCNFPTTNNGQPDTTYNSSCSHMLDPTFIFERAQMSNADRTDENENDDDDGNVPVILILIRCVDGTFYFYTRSCTCACAWDCTFIFPAPQSELQVDLLVDVRTIPVNRSNEKRENLINDPRISRSIIRMLTACRLTSFTFFMFSSSTSVHNECSTRNEFAIKRSRPGFIRNHNIFPSKLSRWTFIQRAVRSSVGNLTPRPIRRRKKL